MEKIVKEILNKEDIDFNYIVKSNVGFTSSVYFVDENYVIKIANTEESVSKIEKEINIYDSFDMEFAPKKIAEGTYNDFRYLIITKLKGKSLFSVWHYLTEEVREDCIKQISEILKFFHFQNPLPVNKNCIQGEFLQVFKNRLLNRLNELNLCVECKNVIEYLKLNFDRIYTAKCDKLIYNDAHFDNFIYNEGKVYLIDFDRVEFAPVDYELMIFKTMCDFPTKFASEEVEKLIHDEDFKNIYAYMKKYYGEMFDISNSDERVYIYQFEYLLEQAVESKNDKWALNLIKNFKEKFNLD